MDTSDALGSSLLFNNKDAKQNMIIWKQMTFFVPSMNVSFLKEFLSWRLSSFVE